MTLSLNLSFSVGGGIFLNHSANIYIYIMVCTLTAMFVGELITSYYIGK